MFNKLILYFIKEKQDLKPEFFRQHKLIAGIIFITSLFDLNYYGITILIGMREGTFITLFTFLMHVITLFLVKTRLSILIITNLYILFGVFSIYGCIFYSGGFNSPVFPWLASTPIVALLMAGRPTAVFWACVNLMVAIVYSSLSKNNFPFPVHYNTEWSNFFYTNTITGLIMIIFLVALVFENGKNKALKQLSEQSLLLAEEKKKTTLNNISQEIHDNVGQTLSIVKMNLHLIDLLKEQNPDLKLKDSVELLGKAIIDLRNISHDLYSENVKIINLVEAVKHELKIIESNYVEAKVDIAGLYSKLDNQTELILIRILKESINNIIKHSQATKINVSLTYTTEKFLMTIKDNGIGMDTDQAQGEGQGIKSMFTRIKLLGGDFKINSESKAGTSICINIPLQTNNP